MYVTDHVKIYKIDNAFVLSSTWNMYVGMWKLNIQCMCYEEPFSWTEINV